MNPATPLAPHRGFRIPTILGLVLIILIVAGVISLFEWVSKKPTSASQSAIPASVALTNISDTAFTVVWTTQIPASGAVRLLTPKHTPSTFFDDRDTAAKRKTTLTHSVTIRSLTPGTLYTFEILSNGKVYTQNGKPYSIATGPAISAGGSGLEPAYGEVHDAQGSPVDGAIVLLTPQQGQMLSTLTSPSGTWLLSLGITRNESLTKYLDGSSRLTESIRVLYQDQEADAITDTLNDAPVPTMILGKTYDFRKQQAKAETSLLSEALPDKPAVLGDATGTKPSVTKTVSLTLPAQNASLTSSLPLIQGTGIPGKKVSVVLGITNPVSGTTTVGGDGIWRYTPTKPLGNGKQSVTATTTDARGKSVALTHTFTVLKSGTQVLGDATPSATLTLTPTPTATQSATPSAAPTPQLEGEPVPTSGTSLPTILILLLGFGLFSSGFVLLRR
ncbi:hypothetical protein HY949_03000 [Candidatus Gottesmanbacteria bacterium]|nr:hypothetical protein [Candidatus Gottesmanbacteria bacterium]